MRRLLILCIVLLLILDISGVVLVLTSHPYVDLGRQYLEVGLVASRDADGECRRGLLLALKPALHLVYYCITYPSFGAP